MNYFKVNDNSTISVKFDNMNLQDISDLIKKLQSNIKYISNNDPIAIMQSTAKRYDGKISYRLSWNCHELEIDLGTKNIPKPNVNLNDEQLNIYYKIAKQMLV